MTTLDSSFARSLISCAAFIAATLLPMLTLAQSKPPATDMKEYLEMEKSSAPFRQFADRWIATARKGDVAALEQSISPNLSGRVGAAVVKRNLTDKVVPFFADAKDIGKSVTITQTTDGFGNRGFAYYMYIVPAKGAERPFVLYVVDESGRMVIANVLTDPLVPDRHK